MVGMQPMLHKLKSVIFICLNYEPLLQIDLVFLNVESATRFLCELMGKSSICQIRNNSETVQIAVPIPRAAQQLRQ